LINDFSTDNDKIQPSAAREFNMKSNAGRTRLFFILAQLISFVIASPPLLRAQQPQKPADDVLRVNTELVQTAFTVVDKDGHFVDQLRQDQMELLIDGKPRPIGFFERVLAGSAREGQVLTDPLHSVPPADTAASVADRGRTIVFFIDDLHLEPDSMHRTRDMLRHFIDNEMSTADSVAIASASGQVGFLQQFTRSKEVLKAAVERFSPIPYDVRGYGTGSTKMSEYMALDIDSRRSDDKVLKVFVAECMKQTNNFMKSAAALKLLEQTCTTQVKESARAILLQSGNITRNMYGSLDSLLKSTARMPGRKLAFFVSDGFLMDTGAHGAELRDRLDHIIDSAQRSGVVVYTIHAKGLVTDFPDASVKTPVDERLDMAKAGETTAMQDALNALAEDTGGRALRGTNYFDRWVTKVLDETSNYYVIAWRPENDQEKLAKFRHVKISVIGHPELIARAPRGYVDGSTAAAAASTPQKTTANHAASTPETELRDALADYQASSGLPASLSLTYLNTPKNEMLLTSSIQIGTSALAYGNDGKQPALVRIAGVILNDKGKIAGSFHNQLNVSPVDSARDGASVIYNDHTPLSPGIYQVRAAARDEKSGRVGSAIQWIVIPDLTTHQLTTSSILLGGQVLENKSAKDTTPQVQLSVDHRFPQASHLGYWLFVYNAKSDGGGAPNLTIQSEVMRAGKVLFTGPPRRIGAGGPDAARIPFGEQLALRSLSPGKYDLRVTVKDELAGTSVTQQSDFEVD
jgi:VWFA-related protein